MLLNARGYMRQPFITAIRRHKDSHLFFKMAGIIWPATSATIAECCLQWFWNLIVRLLLVVCPALMAINFVLFVTESQSSNAADALSNWNLDLFFIAQEVILLLSLISIHRRLNSVCSAVEVSFIPFALKYSVIYYTLSLFPAVMYPLYHLLMEGYHGMKMSTLDLSVFSILPLTEIVIAGFLATHMFFLLVDSMALVQSFAQLNHPTRGCEGCPSKAVRHRMVWAEINHRVRSSLCGVFPILAIAVLEVALVVHLFLASSGAADSTPALLLLFLFLKEILLLLMVLALLGYYTLNRIRILRKRWE